ncbi:putative trans-resveratrol di-O-methyltransferase [Helianthus anomalus]
MGCRDRSTFIDVCQPQLVSNICHVFVYRLMRILVHSGFFVKQSVLTTPGGNGEEGEGYFLAPSSRLLLTRH